MQIEMKIKGLMIDPVTNMPIIILRDPKTEAILPIWVGIFEANAIALEIEKISTPRPMTHDLLKNVIGELGGAIRKVVISELKENTFFALLHVETPQGMREIDSRPSDAIALALRAQAPIHAEQEVITQAKEVDLSQDAAESTRLRKFLETLDEREFGKYEM
jgi:bifunctional DNase/RNase